MEASLVMDEAGTALVPVADDDQEEDKKPLVRKKELDEDDCSYNQKSGRMYRVVAPSDLPQGFRLCVVTSDGETIVVRIPKGGVKAGEAFQGKECGPVTGDWADSEFDCCPNHDGPIFWLAFCCVPMAWACMMKKLGLNFCGCSTASATAAACGFYFVLVCWVAYVLFEDARLFLVVYFIFLATMTRRAVRNKYKIVGSVFMDCFCGTCFGCCSALHSYRQMRRNGDAPEGCSARKPKAVLVQSSVEEV